MLYLILIFAVFLGLMGLVLYIWIKEKRYLKKKTSETMSDMVWEEVEEEREEALRRRHAFRQILEKTEEKK